MPRKKTHANRVYQFLGEPGTGTLVAGYVRYSSELQDPVSILTQKRRIEEYAQKRGWIIIRWYEEPERSAKYEEIGQRPIFAQLLADAGGGFQIVLCYANNRWARNSAVAFTSLNQLRRKRVWWATSDGLWDIDKVQQDGFDVAFAVDTQMNAAYVRQLSKRVIDAKEDRARDGYHNGQVPFGYLRPEYPKAPDGAPSTWKPPRTPVRIDPVNFPALVRIGELAAQGWLDTAIANELAIHRSITPRYGERFLTKDTIAAIRRMWFPCEFAPGCGHGTIETPSGDLVEGRHQAAWPYELWQRMMEVKAGQYRRPQHEAQRRAHEFSRIIVCASCRRALRATPYKGMGYYRDTSLVRGLTCGAYGCLSVKGAVALEQFGAVLASVTLPEQWREAVARQLQTPSTDTTHERTYARRKELEAEQKRLALAFTKGVINEETLDEQVARIRAELVTLPLPQARDTASAMQAALDAGETLADMASYWGEATAEERRDMVWALLALEGLVYDLERQGIVGLIPRPDTLPVLALGLGEQWEQRSDGGLWLRESATGGQLRPAGLEGKPPFRPSNLREHLQAAALAQLRAGQTPQEVADTFGVSYWTIFRLIKRHDPANLPTQQQPKLTPEQQAEARRMLAEGMTLRQVGRHFGVSYGAIWRLTKRDHKAKDSHDTRNEGR